MHTKPCTNHIKQRANEEHYRLDSLCRQLKQVMVAIKLPRIQGACLEYARTCIHVMVASVIMTDYVEILNFR